MRSRARDGPADHGVDDQTGHEGMTRRTMGLTSLQLPSQVLL